MAELEGVALISSTMNQSNEWFIDSAASKHMTGNKSILDNYVQYQEPKSIYLGDSTVILAYGEGKVVLPTVNSTREIVLDLHQVLFAPKLTKNLLSLPAMALMGAEIYFVRDKCLVRRNSQEFVIESLLRDKLYTVNSTEYAQVSTASSAPSPALWHLRLGHLNYTYMNQLMKKEMVDGLNCDIDTQSHEECEACILGKMQKKLFPKQTQHRASKPYEIVHRDIMKLNILAEKNVKILRGDNGGEYTSDKFTKFCADKGILREFTVPYCPQQNGVAERLNRTIMEGARSMLYQAKLPLDFWAEACSTAVYLNNGSLIIKWELSSEDQRNGGHSGPVSTEDQRNSRNSETVVTNDQWNSRYRRPEEQWAQRTNGTVGTVGTEDQWNSVYKGPAEQWVQWTRGTVGTEDQGNSGHRGLVEQWARWALRTSGTVGTKDQGNSGYRGPVGSEDQRNSETRGKVGTEDRRVQRTRGTAGAVGTEKR
ncbi:Retrovirus-related Pol polyprotein from transposon TNT 1-94 [Stylophora pistillata]|uniref:Retrovirus-related Pol polyprotein from transposon TNT 1-94 n=1 Tax=Stylophora pistillata TaxID=50429 RepID=A0A2B4SUV9_STYPI|nr:Retrovirus-related Pol polyprotein from transposon TNT 1-94 [Stylophora pistillata]